MMQFILLTTYTFVFHILCKACGSHLEVIFDNRPTAETKEEFIPVGMHCVHLHAVVMDEQLHSALSHKKSHSSS